MLARMRMSVGKGAKIIIRMTGSRAFYQSKVASKLFHEYNHANVTVQIWQTSCIVTNFSSDLSSRQNDTMMYGTTSQRILVNPSNAELTGCSRFPYFPKGGPVPKQTVQSSVHRDWQPLGFVSSWGGMEVGTGMLYPVSVVDGLVHQLGGWKLQAELKWWQCRSSQPCPVGSAIRTSAGNALLAQNYDAILHTTPPFYQHSLFPELKLRLCYDSTMALVQNAAKAQPTRIAIPLLGAGARGFPKDVALTIAADAMSWWSQQDFEYPVVVAFGLLDAELAKQLVFALESNGNLPSH